MRAETIERELARRAPDMNPEVLGAVAEMAVLAHSALERGRWRRWDSETALAFCGMTDRLVRGLYYIGTPAAETRAEKIAAHAIVLSDRLLAGLEPCGRT